MAAAAGLTSGLGDFLVGVLSSLFAIFVQIPAGLYLVYVILIPFGGLRIWFYGWAHPAKVLATSRVLTIVVGVVILLLAPTDTFSSAAGANMSWFGSGFLTGALGVQTAFWYWRRR
jgi:hypothetical protein